jgi:hypothetical protein
VCVVCVVWLARATTNLGNSATCFHLIVLKVAKQREKYVPAPRSLIRYFPFSLGCVLAGRPVLLHYVVLPLSFQIINFLPQI